jgi:hypothetical protein
MRSVHSFCDRTRENSQLVHEDCVGEYDTLFHEFWDAARPRFDHVLLWDPTDTVLRDMPSFYRPVFHEGKLWLYARTP